MLYTPFFKWHHNGNKKSDAKIAISKQRQRQRQQHQQRKKKMFYIWIFLLTSHMRIKMNYLCLAYCKMFRSLSEKWCVATETIAKRVGNSVFSLLFLTHTPTTHFKPFIHSIPLTKFRVEMWFVFNCSASKPHTYTPPQINDALQLLRIFRHFPFHFEHTNSLHFWVLFRIPFEWMDEKSDKMLCSFLRRV